MLVRSNILFRPHCEEVAFESFLKIEYLGRIFEVSALRTLFTLGQIDDKYVLSVDEYELLRLSDREPTRK